MVATLTFGANSPPRIVADPALIEVFQQSTMDKYTSGTSATGAVHFQNLKVPHGATILELMVWHRQDTSTAGHCHTVGIAGGITSAALFGSESFSQTIRAASMMMTASGSRFPYKVSISDDVAMRYVYPTVTTTTTGTNSISISIGLSVRYTMSRTDA